MRWGSGGQRQNVSLYFSMQLSFLFVCFRIWQFLDYTPTSFKNIFYHYIVVRYLFIDSIIYLFCDKDEHWNLPGWLMRIFGILVFLYETFKDILLKVFD
jgi:hypothetical protein